LPLIHLTMNLVVDVGNTLIKLAVFDGRNQVFKKTVLKSDFDKTLDFLQEEFTVIQNVMLSVVGTFSDKSRAKLKKRFNVFVISPTIKVPFTNDYKTPETLGYDRIALVSAAAIEYPNKNVLIIDVGSCITYDFLNSGGHYKGGAISPGIDMRYKALNHFTEKLPLLDVNIPQNLTGNSTQTSIHSGVINGVTFEVDGIIDAYRQENQDLTVILTGGNAHFLRDRLKNTIFANPNFLLEGLNFLLEQNQNT
jgi:type III pantothenate kinase